jgi:dihydrofolate reductase
MILSLIAAFGPNNEIGLKSDLPWHLRTDFKRFKELTTKHTIIAGRKTYESFQKKPLPNRTNIVISSNLNYHPEGVIITRSLQEAIKAIPKNENEAFIVGGAGLFAQTLPQVSRMYLTKVDYHGPADTFFPQVDLDNYHLISSEIIPADSENDYSSVFSVYERSQK